MMQRDLFSRWESLRGNVTSFLPSFFLSSHNIKKKKMKSVAPITERVSFIIDQASEKKKEDIPGAFSFSLLLFRLFEKFPSVYGSLRLNRPY